MVVILALSVLLAIALPTFLGARTRAWDANAASALRTALTAGIETSDIRSDFTQASEVNLSGYEPSLQYVDASTPSTAPNIVSVDASARDRWVAVVRSDSGSCFAVVAGPYGQTRTEGSSCAAAGVDLDPPQQFIRGVTHRGAVTAVTPGMCLEVIGGFVEQQPCSSSQPSLTITTLGNGYSTLSLADGTCFGTTAPERAARVADEVCEESDDQLWTIVPAVNDTVQFKNKETGYCLDVYGYSSSAGARLIQWGYGDPPDATCKPTTEPNNHNFGFG